MAEMIKPCTFFIHFSVASKSDFVLTKFCMSICKDVLLAEPCNLHDLYSCIDSNEWFLCSPEHFTFWRYKVLSSQPQCEEFICKN